MIYLRVEAEECRIEVLELSPGGKSGVTKHRDHEPNLPALLETLAEAPTMTSVRIHIHGHEGLDECQPLFKTKQKTQGIPSGTLCRSPLGVQRKETELPSDALSSPAFPLSALLQEAERKNTVRINLI